MGHVVVGREAEIARANAVMDRLVDEGRGAGLLVSGPPGVGKTTVAEAVADHARSRGVEVVRGVCSVLERDVPFALWARALRLRPSSEDAARAALGTALHGGDADGVAKLRLLDGISEIVEHAALDQPVVLFLDDLQWADEASLAALERVAELATQLPVLVLATARPFPEPPAAWHWQRHLDRTGDLLTLALSSLDDDAVRRLAEAVLGPDVDDDVVEGLDAAGGNPLFLVELLRDVDASGGLAGGGDDGLPPSVRRSVLRHLEFLDEDQLDLLREAAALGTRFDLGLLADTTGLSSTDLVDRLAPARAAELLVHDDDGLRFAHDLVRDAVHEDEVLELRAARHARIVNRLQAAGREPASWAGHLDLADPDGLDDAGARFHEAGRAASLTHLPTAARLLRRAIELSEPPAGHVLVDLAEVEFLLDPYEPGDSLEFRTMHRTVAPLLAPGVAATLPAEVADRLADAHETGPLVDLVDEDFERVWAELVQAGMSPDAAALRPLHDHVREIRRQFAGTGEAPARDEVAVLAELVRTLQDGLESDRGYPVALVWTVSAWSRVDGRADKIASRKEAMEDLERARRALPPSRRMSPLGMEIERTYAMFARGVTVLGGQAAPAEPIFAELADRYRRMGCDSEAEIHDDHRIASLSVEPHRHRDLLEEHSHDLSRRAARGELPAHDNHQYIWAQLWHLARGRFDEAEVLRDRLADNVPQAVHADEVDDEAAARRWIRDVLATREPGISISFMAARRGLADEIPASHRASSPIIDAIARGDVDDLLDRLSSGDLQPRGWLAARDRREEVALMLVRAGRGEEAVPLLNDALQEAQALGEEFVERRILWQLRELGVSRRPSAGRSTADHGWDAITPTEWRVLDLVEQGLVYREVGERLFVSRRTVESHVANAFRKLGTNSRRDLTLMLREGEGAQRLADARSA